MGATKEYFLKLQEERYNELGNDEKMYLNALGLEVRQIPSNDDLNDTKVKAFNKEIAKLYENRNSYLFEKRNK